MSTRRKVRIKRRKPSSLKPIAPTVVQKQSPQEVIHQGGVTLQAIGNALQHVGRFAQMISHHL